MEPPKTIAQIVTEFVHLRSTSSTAAGTQQEFLTSPEVQRVIGSWRSTLVRDLRHEALTPEQFALVQRLLETSQRIPSKASNPSDVMELYQRALDCGFDRTVVTARTPPPHFFKILRDAEVTRQRGFVTALSDSNRDKYHLSLITDDALHRLQRKVREDVMASQERYRNGLKWAAQRHQMMQQKEQAALSVPALRSMSLTKPLYRERFQAYGEALRLYYTVLEPYNRKVCLATSEHVREMMTKGLDILRKRNGRRLKSLKESDLVAYSSILDKEKLSKFLTIMRRTDELLNDIGVKFAEMVEGKKLPAVQPSLFSTAKGTTAHDEMVKYTSNLTRSYELVHKKKVDLGGVQPRLLTGGTLKSFQMTGVQWLISLHTNNINGILADLMGLGKTVQTIALLCHVIDAEKNPGPHLVFCPLSLVQQWCEEFAEWAPSVRVKALEIKDRGGLLHNVSTGGYMALRYVLSNRQSSHFGLRAMELGIKDGYCNVVVAARNELSYKVGEGARLESIVWGYVIMDEGHAASNAQSKMTTRLREIKSSHRLLLTGTPMKNRIEELWSLLNYINPRIFSDSKEFLDVFNAPLRSAPGAEKQDIELSEDERAILILRLHQVIKPFMLRRCPEDTGEVLPTKSTHRILCPLSALQKRMYELAEECLEPTLTKDGKPTLRKCFRKASVQTLITSHPAALEFIDDIFGEEGLGAFQEDILVRSSGKFLAMDIVLRRLHCLGRKAVVFAQRLDIIDLLERFMRFRGYPSVTLRGDTARESRRVIVEAFQGPDVSVFIASMKSGGQGVDGLQVADVGIFFDLDYTPANDEQAQHRLCRFGQKNHVRILYLTSSSEAENRRLMIAEAKRQNISDVIQEGGYQEPADHHGFDAEPNLANEKGEETDEVIQEISFEDSAAVDKLLARGPTDAARLEALRESDASLLKCWPDIPLPLQNAFAAAQRSYDEEVSGQNLENFGRGKRVRDEYVEEREIPLHILEKYMDAGLSEEDAVEKWEGLQQAKREAKKMNQPRAPAPAAPKPWEAIAKTYPALMFLVLPNGTTVEQVLKSSGNSKAAVARATKKICTGLFDIGATADPKVRDMVVALEKSME